MRVWCFGLTALAAVVAPVSAEESDLSRVTVYGTAITEVVPDQMIWLVGVSNKGPALDQVAQKHAEIVEEAIALLKAAKVEEKEIQTARMEFGENWEYRDESRVKEGYVASSSITFKTGDFGAYRSLWEGLSRIEGASVNGVYYDHSRRIDFQNETRRKAVLAARGKAQEIAQTLGARIAEPLLVEEDLGVSEGWTSRFSNVIAQERTTAGDAAGSGGFLAPGNIPIQIRVKASFRLVSTAEP